jgi:hypothetical protein
LTFTWQETFTWAQSLYHPKLIYIQFGPALHNILRNIQFGPALHNILRNNNHYIILRNIHMGSIIQFGPAFHNTSSRNTNLDNALTEWPEERRHEVHRTILRL